MRVKGYELTVAEQLERVQEVIERLEYDIARAERGEVGRSDKWRKGMIRFWRAQLADARGLITGLVDPGVPPLASRGKRGKG